MAEGGILVVSLGQAKPVRRFSSRPINTKAAWLQRLEELVKASIPVSHVREIADLSLKVKAHLDNPLPSPLHSTHTFPIGSRTKLNT